MAAEWNGWKSVVISFLAAVTLASGASYLAFGQGKAEKTELEAHERSPGHEATRERVTAVEKDVALIEQRVTIVEGGLQSIQQQLKGLPKAVAEELERRRR